MGPEETQPPSDVEPLLDGRYRLGRLLGRGGAATVYEAVDTVLGRSVAVKFYQPSSHAVGLYRFAAEARLLAGLSHPGLVMVYDVSLDGDRPYLVMRLVDGPTLRDLLDRGPLEPAAVAKLGAQLAAVLAYVHGKDVVHRDVKPSNVLVDESGTSYLADFGIARALSATHLTVSGEFVGTAAYLAPEQVTDVETGPPVDIYALGLLLLECLTGETEYTGTTIESALARLSRPPRIPESLPPAWHTVLTAMTALDPAARPDASRCAQLLTTIAEDTTAVVAAEPPPAPPVPQPAPSGSHPRRAARLLRPVPAAMSVTALAAAAATVIALTTSTTVPGLPAGDSPPTSTQQVPSGQEAVADPAEATPPARDTDEQTVPAVNADLPADPSQGAPTTSSPDTTPSPTTTPTSSSTPPTTEPTTTEPPDPTDSPSSGPEPDKNNGGAGKGGKGKG